MDSNLTPSFSPDESLVNRKLRFESIDPIRSIYRSASKAYLLNNPLQVWSAIQIGLESIHQSLLPSSSLKTNQQKPWWIQGQSSIDSTIDHELRDLERKFQILRITFFTSIIQSCHSIINQINSTAIYYYPHSSLLSQSINSTLHTESFLSILDLIQSQDPIEFILCLIISIQSNQIELRPHPPSNLVNPQSRLIQLSSSLNHLHPSIITALGLATIKLNIPHIGKQLIEGWLASIDCSDLASINPTPSLNYQQDPYHYPNHQAYSVQPPLTNDLRTSYQNLIQVYSIHILGSLDEWEFAIDLVNAQSHQCGGILPPETVQNILEGIELKKSQQIRFIKRAIYRQQKQQQQQQQQAKQKTNKNAPPRRESHEPQNETSSKRTPIKKHDHDDEDDVNDNDNDKRHTGRQASTSDDGLRPHQMKNKLANHHHPNAGTDQQQQLTGFSSLRNQLSKFISGDSPPKFINIDHHQPDPSSSNSNANHIVQKESIGSNRFLFFRSVQTTFFDFHHRVYFKFFLTLFLLFSLFKKINQSYRFFFSLLLFVKKKFNKL